MLGKQKLEYATHATSALFVMGATLLQSKKVSGARTQQALASSIAKTKMLACK